MAILPIQVRAEQSTSSVSSFTTSAMTVTAGNAIVACMSGSVAGSSLSATDSLRNSYTNAIVFQTGSFHCVGISRALLIAGGATTYTVTPSAAMFCTISAQEYSGMDSGVGPTNSGTATSNAVSPGAVTPTWTNALYVACWAHEGVANQTFNFNFSKEGWQQRSNLIATANEPLGSQDLVSTGSKTGSVTLGGVAALWGATVATFQPLGDTATTATAIVSKRVSPQQRVS